MDIKDGAEGGSCSPSAVAARWCTGGKKGRRGSRRATALQGGVTGASTEAVEEEMEEASQ
ncbi:hypothetical protein E2562_022235 [Oryza meyeriana var. granulata]|uniref:Uncharacterized protein n=1 Tax=Oryza meyeriana var. granulata TaxID=110450 RepID=A0A6G1ENW8_9ORYZ|nr:hypothetical protein E2562_022235 [Oryza meyeriana var. granulata]